MKREVFSEKLVEIMWGSIKKEEGKARKRRLPREVFDKAVAIIDQNRYGNLRADGGRVCHRYANSFPGYTTVFEASWYTWRNRKFIVWQAYRLPMPSVANGRGPDIEVKTHKGAAYAAVFPNRYERYKALRARHLIRLVMGYDVPDAQEVWDVWEKTPLILLSGEPGDRSCRGRLATPDGVVKIVGNFDTKRERTVKYALQRLTKLRIRKNTPWEVIQGEVILAVLS